MEEKEKVDVGGTDASGPPTKRAKRTAKTKPDAVLYHCNYCRKDISNVIRIKCAQCADFDLCVECFSVGVELGAHKNYHDYHVMDILNFPLFEEEWGADEELLLLEGIEMYGMGNWGDVSDHVGTKSNQECKTHYFNVYINVPTAPMPDLSKVLTTAETLQELRNRMRDAPAPEEPEPEEVPEPQREGLERRAKSDAIAQREAERAETQSKPNAAFVNHDLAGYMYLRGDFETEWENEAEQILMDMSFTDDDTPVERDMKLRVLESYNQKLDERIRRKQYIKEQNLFEYKKIEKRYGRDKDLWEKLRPFLRVLGKEEHGEFLQNLLEERTIRRRIDELKKYRRMGYRTLMEAEGNARRRDSGLEISTRGKREKDREASNPYERPTLTRSSKWLSRDREEIVLSPKPRKPGAPLDISTSVGYDLLSEKERELCSSLRIYPQQYMVIKDTLLRESLRVGVLKKAVARQLIKIDVNKTSRIFDFLESAGWINKPPNAGKTTHNALPPIKPPESQQLPETISSAIPPPIT